MAGKIQIGDIEVGFGCPTFMVAEMSANHGQSFDQAVKIMEAAKDSGADAIKIQTYTPDTLTIKSDTTWFKISGTPWDGKTLHDLYSEAYTPWEWQPKLRDIAKDMDLVFFSTPFDPTAVDFLEELAVPAYKIASFEIVDLPLIGKISKTGKPLILSTGMANFSEIEEAVTTFRDAGGTEIILLKCTSAYPAKAEDMNLKTIPELAKAFDTFSGLSDHTLGIEIPIAAVALGACLIEKHLTLSRNLKGPDSQFSLEPHEFKEMVESIRKVESAMGRVEYGPGPGEKNSMVFRRSLFVTEDIEKGNEFTAQNVRSIRPGNGLHTRYLNDILGRKAKTIILKGTPLTWDLVV